VLAAVQLKLNKKNVIIFCVYRTPSGNFDYFLNKLDNILHSLHNYKSEFIICGNININYLGTNNKKKQLDNLLGTYNLTGTVYFPTRMDNNSITVIDNIFVDNRRKYSIQPCINRLSDHNAQLLTLNNVSVPNNNITMNFNKTQYVEFRTKNYYNVNTQIQSDQKSITNSTEIKFLGLIIDDTLSWKQHIEHIVNRMCTACYALRNIIYVVPIDTLRVIYFAHIHSIMSYGIIF